MGNDQTRDGGQVMTINVGIIGAGANTKALHLPHLRAIPGVTISAVANRSVQSAESVANDWSIPVATDDPWAILGDPEIDAVVIGTWPDSHKEYSIAALENDKHVLCEARMTTDFISAREMSAAAEHSHSVAHIVPAPMTLGVDDMIRSFLNSSEFGELKGVKIAHSFDTREPNSAWRNRTRYSGHNVLSSGIWYESLVRWLDPIEQVYAVAPGFDEGLKDGVLPTSLNVLGANSSGTPYSMDLHTHTTEALLEGLIMRGTRGDLEYDLHLRKLLWYPCANSNGWEYAASTNMWTVEEDFIAAIREEQTSGREVSFSRGLEYMRFVDGVWKSLSEKRSVNLSEIGQ